MAAYASTPAIIIHSDQPNLRSSKFQTLKNPNFSTSLQKVRRFFPRKTHHNSFLSSTGHPTCDPNTYLKGLCKKNQLDQAIVFLVSLEKESRNSIDEKTFVSLIRLCELRRALDEGCLIYEYVLNLMSQLSLRLGNALLSMFVRLGSLGDAWYVFGKMEERDVFSWNVLIGGYAKNGYFDEAMDMYHKMLWVGFRPDVYTFPCILRTCGGMKDIKRGREIHVHVVRFGFESEVDVVNALITMYVKCGDLGSARMLFDRMPNRDRISWNAMISGCFENGEFLEGLRSFLLMQELCIDPDLMTMTSVISACEVLGDARLAKTLHGYVARTEFSTDVSVDNALIQMYSSVGNWEEAERIFNRIESKDVVSWTSMISGYERNGLPEMAVKTYEMMERDNIVPDEITVASVLPACASLNLFEEGSRLHELAKSTGLISYVIVANALIDFYSKCGCIDKALEIFYQLPDKNVISWTSIIVGLRINNRSFEALILFQKMILSLQPNDVTLISVLGTCGRIGALMYGKEIHAHVLRNGLGFDGFLPNALLNMYVRCGRTTPSWNQFNMQKQDVSSWNILLTGYAQRGQGALAVELFSRMMTSGVEPNEITFISLLCACSRSGMTTEGLKYFDDMKNKYCIAPNLKHYACVVDLLGRAGKLDDAFQFIEEMPIKPDTAIWGALLNSCRIHRNVDLGELAARHIIEMDKEMGYFILLHNFYSDFGKLDEISRLRTMMTEKGITVDPGCSWVEVKGKVHAFLIGDNFHPQIKEINLVLEGFYEKMKAAGIPELERIIENEPDSSKAEIFCGHSERLAIAFALLNTAPGTPIWVTKNLYMCQSCHSAVKFFSKVVRREITVKDTENFHHFKDGNCSCGDEGYWGKS